MHVLTHCMHRRCILLPECVGTQTRGLGPYNTNQEIPALGAGGETVADGVILRRLGAETERNGVFVSMHACLVAIE